MVQRDVEGRIKAGGIMQRRNLCLVGVMSAPDRPGLASAIFEAMGKHGLNAEFIVQSIDLRNDSHVQFCVAESDAQRVMDVLDPIARNLQARKVTLKHGVSMLSVFGPDFRELPGIAGTAFGALAGVGVNILAVSTSISTITCVVLDEGFESALAALRQVFQLP
jgi:aspartate kinase